MSIKVMSYVWDHSESKGTELLLLLAIADHAADDGYCWPSIDALATKTRVSTRSVMRGVKALEERGELYVMRGNRNNRYVVTGGRTTEQIAKVLESRKETIGDNLSRDIQGAIGDTGVTPEVTQLCHPNHHESSMNRHTPNDAGASLPDADNDAKAHNALQPSTPEELAMFKKLKETAEAAGRRGPRRFKSLQCQEKFRAAADSLGNEFDTALTKALEQGITSVVGVTNYVAKWAHNNERRSKPSTIKVGR